MKSKEVAGLGLFAPPVLAGVISLLERRTAEVQNEQDQAKWENVSFHTIVGGPTFIKDFRSHWAFCPNHFVDGQQGGGDEAKVGKSQRVVSSDHHVVNFKVKVAQVILVHGVEGSTELCEHASQQRMISDWSRFAD